ncbi:hypothetical protein GQ44DRAFT_711979 [Phaeosphaeriaceae sp. PMI808]|nr:hypothetical protein GQ44DRAFT_711979 [Phaeosphaeriaceae sp. PMI808]
MSSRGPQSAYSSHPTSPTAAPARYDPFASDADPVELYDIPRQSLNHHNTGGTDGTSPLQSPDPDDIARGRGSLRPDSYFGLSYNSGGQYAPLPGQNESPGRPSLRAGRESMYTLNSLYQTKQIDADTQALVDRRAGEIAQWHIHWTTPAIIAVLFLAGVGAAVGHHFFYLSLHGAPAHNQLGMIRWGTGLAFFVKSTLVGTAIICNRQRIWRTFRRKAMTIEGIDGLFSAPEDPTQFFINMEMWKNGKLATFMALCSWLIPLASIAAPASLTVQLTNFEVNQTCANVGTLNFARESTFNFRKLDPHEDRRASASYYNTTDLEGTKEGYFDYYDQPSKNVRRLAISAAYLRRPQTRERAAVTFCGPGWNCTYSINFEGPGYKCEDVTTAPPPDAPIDLKLMAPQGNFTYLAEVDQNEYKSPQIDTVGGVPRQPPPYPASLGVFESEPILWIAFANKTNVSYEASSPYATKWKVVHEPKMFKCVMYHTNYTFEMSYRPIQTAVLKQRDFLRPVIDTTLKPNLGNRSHWIASPQTNFIRPSIDPKIYKLTAAYHSMGSLLRNFLRGSVEKTTNTFTVTRSDISETRLMDARNSHPSQPS